MQSSRAFSNVQLATVVKLNICHQTLIGVLFWDISSLIIKWYFVQALKTVMNKKIWNDEPLCLIGKEACPPNYTSVYLPLVLQGDAEKLLKKMIIASCIVQHIGSGESNFTDRQFRVERSIIDVLVTLKAWSAEVISRENRLFAGAITSMIDTNEFIKLNSSWFTVLFISYQNIYNTAFLQILQFSTKNCANNN